MVARALLSFLALPGIVAILAPPLIATLDPWRGTSWAPGIVLLLLGTFGLIWCARDFYASGRGTLAPWDPPQELVTLGLYRLVRNPMYVSVLAMVAGWALYLLSAFVALYLVLLALAFHIRVLRHEEPWLATRFGPRWSAYQAAVPRWLPRVTRRDRQ